MLLFHDSNSLDNADEDDNDDDDDDDDDDIYIYNGEVSVSHKSHYFSRDLVVFLFLDTFRIQKCLETVKRQNPMK